MLTFQMYLLSKSSLTLLLWTKIRSPDHLSKNNKSYLLKDLQCNSLKKIRLKKSSLYRWTWIKRHIVEVEQLWANRHSWWALTEQQAKAYQLTIEIMTPNSTTLKIITIIKKSKKETWRTLQSGKLKVVKISIS